MTTKPLNSYVLFILGTVGMLIKATSIMFLTALVATRLTILDGGFTFKESVLLAILLGFFQAKATYNIKEG